MKKQIIVIAYILIGYTNIVFSQNKIDPRNDMTETQQNSSREFNTIFGKGTIVKVSGYGGPFFSLSQINGDAALLIGGLGGVLINDSWVFGAYGYGNIISNTFSGKDKKNVEYDNLKTVFGSGGMLFEYIHNLNKPIHLSFPLMVGIGVVQVIDNDNNLYSSGLYYQSNFKSIESTSTFVIQPGVNLEFNMARYFIPAVSLSYRYVSFINDNMINVSSSDFSNLNLTLLFKFGGF